MKHFSICRKINDYFDGININILTAPLSKIPEV